MRATDLLQGPCYEQYYRSRAQYGREEYEQLVHNVQHGDVAVLFDCLSPASEQVQDVCHCRRAPSASLVEEFLEHANTV